MKLFNHSLCMKLCSRSLYLIVALGLSALFVSAAPPFRTGQALSFDKTTTMKVTADTTALKKLPGEIRQQEQVALRALGEHGTALLKAEAPGGSTSKIAQGVKAEYETPPSGQMKVELSVSAIAEREGGAGVLHLSGGGTRPITLRGGEPFDYAAAVAEGTGVFGPHHTPITPRSAGVLLIPVSSVPTTVRGKPESYIEKGGKRYILRPQSEGMRPDHYDVRAWARLDAEAVEIFTSAFKL